MTSAVRPRLQSGCDEVAAVHAIDDQEIKAWQTAGQEG